jgi:hypothetical protein
MTQPSASPIHLATQVRLTRTGMAMRLVQNSGKAANDREPDQPLIKLLVLAQQWWARLSEGDINIETLARKAGVNASWMTRVVRLAFLAPELLEAIVTGKQPAHLDAATLLKAQLPHAWEAQAALLSAA